MFRHEGKSRTFIHNLKLASLLSFVAGIVNIAGFFAVHTLTTNLTGHFAFFADELINRNTSTAVLYLLYVLFFFTGAFISGFLVEYIYKIKERYKYVIPILIELTILTAVSLTDKQAVTNNPHIIAYALLFAMGMQNALVTGISGSAVRTTHLTGLFTDLGIELSQLFFYNKPEQVKKLHTSIKLRSAIILFFLLGCFAGGWGYLQFDIRILLLAAIVLAGGLMYDSIKFKIVSIKRKYQN